MQRVLITGAAGALGKVLREKLNGAYPTLRLSDAAEMEPPRKGEEVVRCELSDAGQVDAMCRGVDAIVHLGGQSVEAPWPRVMQSNIVGLVNLYEGARKAGVKKILFATSNHAVGFYRRTKTIDHTAGCRPDSRYGLSKAFGEDVSFYYAHKHGIAGFCMRIGSCFPKPVNARMLWTWQSYPDFARLVRVGLAADYTYEIVYGVSRNTRMLWDNSNAYRLGYDPRDDAEAYAKEVEHLLFDNPADNLCHGGNFISPDFTGDISKIP